MPMNRDNLSAEAQEHLTKIEKHKEYIEREERDFWQKYGQDESDDDPSALVSTEGLRTKLREEREGSLLFDRLSPAERLALYNSNRDEWKKMMAAKEAAGYRKLMGT